MQEPSPASDTRRDSFEARWRERFEEFAELRDDDAGIAGWSPSGLDARFRFFTRRWQGAAPESLWLDVGCGAGTYSRWLAAQGMRAIGLDYSQPTLAKAQQRLRPEIALVAGDALRLPFPDATFGGALCFGVLQAVSESAPVVREIARILADGATLWIDALNRDGIATRVSEVRRRLRGKERHLRYESARALGLCLAESGFTDIRLHWLPLVPARLRGLQPLLESRLAVSALASLPAAGALVSHSFAYSARKRRG